MKISIITVVRNDRIGVSRTIASVRSQSYSEIEFVVIDGASDDGTIESIRAQEGILHCWISEPDAGIYDAMNKGLERATGDYVLFLNAGDTFLSSTSLESAVTFLRQCPQADVVYFDAEGEHGYSAAAFTSPAALQFDSIGNHQALFVRLSLHQQFRFDTRYGIKADRDAQLRMFLAGNVLQCIPTAITSFEPGGISSTAIGRKEWENLLICWRNRVHKHWLLAAGCLAISRVCLHAIARCLGFDWTLLKLRLRSMCKHATLSP